MVSSIVVIFSQTTFFTAYKLISSTFNQNFGGKECLNLERFAYLLFWVSNYWVHNCGYWTRLLMLINEEANLIIGLAILNLIDHWGGFLKFHYICLYLKQFIDEYCLINLYFKNMALFQSGNSNYYYHFFWLEVRVPLSICHMTHVSNLRVPFLRIGYKKEWYTNINLSLQWLRIKLTLDPLSSLH